MRALGIDYGARRIGLALSDPSGILASPWRVLERPRGEAEAVRLVCDAITTLAAEGDGLTAVVVGWPRRLDGSANDQTPRAEAFANALRARVPMPVVLQDERLSSHEADQRLAEHRRDWRERKRMLDAAAAAVVLQDYLDARPRG